MDEDYIFYLVHASASGGLYKERAGCDAAPQSDDCGGKLCSGSRSQFVDCFWCSESVEEALSGIVGNIKRWPEGLTEL